MILFILIIKQARLICDNRNQKIVACQRRKQLKWAQGKFWGNRNVLYVVLQGDYMVCKIVKAH